MDTLLGTRANRPDITPCQGPDTYADTTDPVYAEDIERVNSLWVSL